MVDYPTLKGMIYSDMYFPIRWPRLAQALEVLITGNATGILTQLGSAATGLAGESPPDADAVLGIKCGDKQIRSERIDDVMPGVDTRWALSRLGGDVSDISAIQCSRWKMDAKERYAGDFRVDPAYPVLLISTQHDPVSPLVSAKNMSSSWKGSVVLEQEGYGVSFLLFNSCLQGTPFVLTWEISIPSCRRPRNARQRGRLRILSAGNSRSRGQFALSTRCPSLTTTGGPPSSKSCTRSRRHFIIVFLDGGSCTLVSLPFPRV